MATHDPLADHDYQEHLENYHAFLFGVRTFVITAAIILALLAFFLLR